LKIYNIDVFISTEACILVVDIKSIVKDAKLKITRDWIVVFAPGGNINGIRFHKNTVLICGADKGDEIEVREFEGSVTRRTYFAKKILLAESSELVK
jgi:hypothetical protein